MKSFRIVAGSESADVFVYGDIGGGWFDGVTAKEFADELKTVKSQDVNVRINSFGGDVFAGLAIYNQLRSHKGAVHVHVDGIAASAASIVAMAGETITMHEGTQMMVHNPWAFVAGGAEDMRKMADRLERTTAEMVGVYSRKTGIDSETVASIMAEETWYTAEDAVAAGFATHMDESLAVAACGGAWAASVFATMPQLPEPVESEPPRLSAEQMLMRARLARAKG